MGALGRAFLCGLLGAFVAPVGTLVAGLVVYRFAPGCGSPGDSGGCEMGLVASMIASVPFGGGLCAVLSLIRTVLRRRARRSEAADRVGTR